MATITVKADTCKGCGLCMTACPRKIIGFDREKINSKGYHPAVLLEMCIRDRPLPTRCKKMRWYPLPA